MRHYLANNLIIRIKILKLCEKLVLIEQTTFMQISNTSGAGWIVRTQKDRDLFYQNYNLALLESRNCVGWHYFKYQDNDPTAKGVDPSNIDANKGIVNNVYEVWKPMMEEMKTLNDNVYQLIAYFDSHEKL